MAFVCVRYLEYILSLRAEKLSPEVIRKSLLQVQASIVKDEFSGKRFLLTSPLSVEAKRIYQVISIKIPQRDTCVFASWLIQILSWQARKAKFVKKVRHEIYEAVLQRLLPLIGVGEFSRNSLRIHQQNPTSCSGISLDVACGSIKALEKKLLK